ncbi:thiamine-monophosphate kinase, partial [Pseudoalteromonas rubra]
RQLVLGDKQVKRLEEKLHFPTPRVAAGQVLRGMATACIDISDGLLADLQHILNKSAVGAIINIEDVPVSPIMKQLQPESLRRELSLAYGDDYELLFTVNDSNKGAVEARLRQYGVEPVCIGQVTASTGKLELFNAGEKCPLPRSGYQHF